MVAIAGDVWNISQHGCYLKSVCKWLPWWTDTIQNSLKRSQSFPRSATPVPPTGLNFGDFVEDYEMMEGNSILDLGNAPPLFQGVCKTQTNKLFSKNSS